MRNITSVWRKHVKIIETCYFPWLLTGFPKNHKNENGNTTLYINDLVHIVSNENVGKIWLQRTMLKVR